MSPGGGTLCAKLETIYRINKIIMKKIKVYNFFVIVLLFTCLVTVSCKKYIDCGLGQLTLSFVSFSDSEIDTIIVKRFDKNNGFLNTLDSIVIDMNTSNHANYNDTVVINFSIRNDHNFSSKYDYIIYLPKIERTYKVNNIIEQYDKMRNSGGLFSFDKRYCVNNITTYSIDNVVKNTDYYQRLYINK